MSAVTASCFNMYYTKCETVFAEMSGVAELYIVSKNIIIKSIQSNLHYLNSVYWLL